MSKRSQPNARLQEIVGESAALREVLVSVKRLAAGNTAILITGEAGTGKELIARAIHHASSRRYESFVKIESSTKAPNLLKRNLSKSNKGVFVGLTRGETERLRLADKGTLFVDEIANLPWALQSALVGILKRRELERLDNTSASRVNIRLIAATKHNLQMCVTENCFLGDLYNELKTSLIRIPPLRERREDIPLLARYFVRKFARQVNKTIPMIPAETIDALSSYKWQGNVGQLENFIERSVNLTTGPNLESVLDEL